MTASLIRSVHRRQDPRHIAAQFAAIAIVALVGFATIFAHGTEKGTSNSSVTVSWETDRLPDDQHTFVTDVEGVSRSGKTDFTMDSERSTATIRTKATPDRFQDVIDAFEGSGAIVEVRGFIGPRDAVPAAAR